MGFELAIIIFITSLLSGFLLRYIIQSRNDKVINQLQTENIILRQGVNNLGNYYAKMARINYKNDSDDYAEYNANGQRIN